MKVIVERLAAPAGELEIVEHKGIGHPDTLCDAISAQASAALCRFYRDRFGQVMHHNVDKSLLAAGRSRPAFRGGEVVEPMTLILAGRATDEVDGVRVPVAELVEQAARSWLRDHLHALDAERHVRFQSLVRPGSRELVDLYRRGSASGVWLANDTSFGTGHAPPSLLERVVLAVARRLREACATYPEVGEDVKVLGVRVGESITLTVACAFIGRHLDDLEHYLARRANVQALALEAARAVTDGPVVVEINAADAPERGQVYLTVTGTSAEAGDDGQTGRGNRVGGLITPFQPMAIEAAAGKNPVTHVGMIYGVLARRIATALVRAIPDIERAQCFLASRIGHPVADPPLVGLRLSPRPGRRIRGLGGRAEAIARAELATAGTLAEELISGRIPFATD